jgi:ribosome biogenesis protein MAK21
MEEEPSLEDVIALGGTEDDLELMKLGRKDNNELEISPDEVYKYINEIGLGEGEMGLRDEEESKGSNKLIKTSSMEAPKSESEPSKIEKKLMSLTVKDHNKLLFELDNDTPWANEAQSEVGAMLMSQNVLDHLYSLSRQVMATEMKLYQKEREKKRGKDVKWLKTVLTSGTLTDRIAALTLIIQESAVHSLPMIDQFIGLCRKKSKRVALLAIDHLKDLLVSDVLPEARKLKYVKQRPVEDVIISDGKGQRSCDIRKLYLWYFEDQLKVKYSSFVNLLKEMLHDPVSDIREKILGVVFDLLYNRPEQEQMLLKLVINKIGDPNRKLASKCILLLLKLLNRHVNMKLVVIREFEYLLHRPNLSPKAQYYSVCFLNQIIITPNNPLLPQKLINLYFSFFKIYVERNEYDSKMLNALLTGLNRALPFTKSDIPSFDEHVNCLFKIVHVSPLSTSVQSLTLLYQVMESHHSVSSRYYRALYRKVTDVELITRTGQQAMFLNLLHKSLKSDPELNRNKSFIKRLLQSCEYHMPHFICGLLLVISELLKDKPSLWSFILQSSGDDEQIFHDVQEECDGDGDGEHDACTLDDDTVKQSYMKLIHHREPLYADVSCIWELSTLTTHYHPSVRVFANKLAMGDVIVYDSNPLTDFTVLNFVDHFIHKNPKQKKSDHGGSLMQPMENLMGVQSYALPSEFTNNVKERKSKKMKKDDSDSEVDFSYSDMSESDDSDNYDDDDDDITDKKEYNEDELEELLLANLSSSDDEDDSNNLNKNKFNKRTK